MYSRFSLRSLRLHSTTCYRTLVTKARVKPNAINSKPENEDDGSGAGDNPNAVLQPPFQAPGDRGRFSITKSPSLDAAITTAVGITMVFIGGIAYFAWYKKNVLDKIEAAFEPGYDPALELATHVKPGSASLSAGEAEEDDWKKHLRRREQDAVDRIIQGKETGRYFGSGKGTMIFDAMHAVMADGVAFCEAHPDLEVFRLRIGKALNFEFNEDTQTGLFQRRDPREGGPALDIERALNKVEKVGLRLARKRGRPLVMIFNNVHLLKNDENGRNLLLQLQQRAETWAESGIMTMVFATDDFWPFLVLRNTANRMQVLSISDLNCREAVAALTKMRLSTFPHGVSESTIALENRLPQAELYRKVVDLTGGRLAFLSKVSRSHDMLRAAHDLVDGEKTWILDHIGLIPDLDDDVMDEQKWSSCSWLLLQEFVNMRLEQEKEREEQIATGTFHGNLTDSLPMPSIPYWRCRQIMTRPDFLEGLDDKNIITIDIHSNVRPDSVLTLEAARQVVTHASFEDILQNVRDRVDEIESLHRTSEMTLKDFPALSLKNLTEQERKLLEKRKKEWIKGKSSWI